MRIEFESNEIPIYRTITEDDEGIDTPELIQSQLMDVANNLGYQYQENSSNNLGRGIISIRNDVNIILNYDNQLISMYVSLGDSTRRNYEAPLYDCSNNCSTIDDISVALQTASMICAEIRKRLM